MSVRLSAGVIGCASLLVLGSASGTAQRVAAIQVGVSPGFPANTAVRELAAEWQAATGGRSRMRLTPVPGDERALVRRLRSGAVEAAALTTVGLFELDEAFAVLTLPFAFASDAELAHVIDELRPLLRRRLADRGVAVVHLGLAGWVRAFSREPVRTLDDLRRLRVAAVGLTDDRLLDWYRDQGLRPVAMAAADVLVRLETGAVDVAPATAMAALTLDWYRYAPYMLDTGVAPLLVAIVVAGDSWARLADADRDAVLAAGRRTDARLADAVGSQQDEAIAEMVTRGLTVVATDRATWREAADQFSPDLRGPVIPPDVYDRAMAVRAAFRRSAR